MNRSAPPSNLSPQPKPSVSLDSRVRIPDSVVFKELAGETVLLHLDTGVYFGLDPVGTRIWQLLQEHRQLQDVLPALVQEFEVEEEQCRADLLQFGLTLCSHGLLELIPPAEVPKKP